MKQKFVIGFSVSLLLLAVILIARDLFRETPDHAITPFSGNQDRSLKEIDPPLIGYQQIKVIETGLEGLSGVSVTDDQQIYVSGDSQVAVFNNQGDKIGAFAIDSTANCIEVVDQNIYIAIGSRIEQYAINGTLESRWKPYNTKGYITSIAADNEFVYGADAINKKILKYNTAGELIQEIGKKDSLTRSPGFIIPSPYFDVELGGYNDLWVVNPGYLRLENFANDGNLRTSWGEPSFDNDGFSGCCNPVHMALLPDGSFITYEKGVDKIKEFGPAGQFKNFVAGAGSFKGETDFQLGPYNNLVKDLATDKTGLVYILDAYDRICVFKKSDI